MSIRPSDKVVVYFSLLDLPWFDATSQIYGLLREDALDNKGK